MRGHDADEEVLVGGNVTPVVRRGDTVHREAGAWTPAVHRLLQTLRDAGVDEVPEPRGSDANGREVLSYIPGRTLVDCAPDVRWSSGVLVAAGKLLRRIHDASRPLVNDRALIWRSSRRTPAEVICHNDFATYNLIADGDTLSGVIDFDFASPGPRVWDLAYLAYRIVPFAEDAPDADGLKRARRLDQLIATYGGDLSAADVMAAMVSHLEDLRLFTLGRFAETGRAEFRAHADMYGRDADRLR